MSAKGPKGAKAAEKPGGGKAGESRRVNVEIAPAIRRRLEQYMRRYNRRPERTTAKLSYTDVINSALARFFEPKRKKREAGDGG